MRRYAALHRSITARKAGDPLRRILLHEHRRCGGLADLVTGLITAFLGAVLSGRALQIDAEMITDAFQLSPHHANITLINDAVTAAQRSRSGHFQCGRPNPNHDKERFNMGYLGRPRVHTDNPWTWQWYRFANLTRFFGGDSVAVMETVLNRGQTFAAFANPAYRDMLEREWGVSPATCFGCLFNWLLVPRASVFAPSVVPPATAAAVRNRSAIVIGVHIRTGDQSQSASGADSGLNVDVLNGPYASFFHCAVALEASVRASLARTRRFAEGEGDAGVPIRWFVASDSLALRLAARRQFGDRVLTIERQSEHSLHATAKTDGYYLTYAELMLLSECDYLVVTTVSGFSKVAAFRGLPLRRFPDARTRNLTLENPAGSPLAVEERWAHVTSGLHFQREFNQSGVYVAGGEANELGLRLRIVKECSVDSSTPLEDLATTFAFV